MNENSVIGAPLGGPLYKAVMRQIMESLRKGEWKPGEVLPSETKLGERFGVSIGTIRKAVDELTAEGILIRHQGRGTFVAAHNQDRYLFAFFHVVRQDGHKEYPKVDLVEFGQARADVYAAARLRVAPGSRLFRFVNRLELGGEPVILDEIFVPQSLFPGLTEKRLRERETTLYQLYQDTYGITVIRTEERLRATQAGDFHAGILGIAQGAPLLQIIRVALSFKDQPVELRYSYVNTARYEYFAERAGTL